jgi:hypothetical protein
MSGSLLGVYRVTNEELKYLANSRSEWDRRIRELRTEDGWPIVTRSSHDPSLPVGVYVLQVDRQAPAHDRKIKDIVRVQVLEPDSYRCTNCDWSKSNIREGDPRSLLELHHLIHHVRGGTNAPDNLVTLCNVCHD